jgi:iron complex transport system substrate-binding protein
VQLHLPVLALHTDSIDAIEASLLLLGTRTGTLHQAKAVVAQMQKQRRKAHAIAASDRHPPRVLLVIGLDPLFVAGQGTFLGDVLTEAGGVNMATITGYGSLSKETVLAHPPDVIAADPRDQAALRADPVLRLLPTVRQGRFVWVRDPNLLVRPGPRVADGLLALAQALHADAR